MMLIRNRKRDELACELCDWTWLVPIDGTPSDVLDKASRHWHDEHYDWYDDHKSDNTNP